MSDLKESLVLTKIGEDYLYNRCLTDAPDYALLKHKLEDRYEAKTLLASSGMHAISAVINAILINENDVNLIHGNELYCDVPRLFKYLQKIYKFQRYEIDVTQSSPIIDLFETKLKSQTNVLFIESASNPSGYIFDTKLIPRIRRLSKKLYVIVDNTWLSSAIFNPLKYHADIVVTSLTKYYSAGTCIAGAIMTKQKIYQKIYDYIRFNGHHISPKYCQLINQQIDQLDTRIQLSSKLTVEIAAFLNKHPKVIKVNHSSLDHHPSHQLSKQLFKYYPSVLTFTIKATSKDMASQLMRDTEIEFKTSFGATMSRFDPWPIISGTEMITCRLAIGYMDNYQRLIDILDLMLSSFFAI